MHRLILKASRALVGPDLQPVEQIALSIEDGRISEGSVDPGAEVIELVDVTLLPGFIDAHVHIGFFHPAEVLHGGVTTVRDLAWPPEIIYDLATRSRSATFSGPLVVCVGPMLTVAGGYPTRAPWAPPGTGRVVRSVTDARAAVDEQAARGAVAIKVGLNSAVGPTLDATTLRAICDAAHSHGLRVTAHIDGLEELDKAIEAGVDECAHILMSPELIPATTIERMVSGDMVVVPTLSIFTGRALNIAIENVAVFVAAGGRIVYGTDLGNSGPRPGIDASEIDALVRAGLDGHRIAVAATRAGAQLLGLKTKGILEPGYDADIVGVRGDPTVDPEALYDVRFVMREGRIVRSP